MYEEPLVVGSGLLKTHWTLKGHLHKPEIFDDAIFRFCGSEYKIALLINFEAVSVKRATSLGIHQIGLEDASGLDPLHLLNFLYRLGLDD